MVSRDFFVLICVLQSINNSDSINIFCCIDNEIMTNIYYSSEIVLVQRNVENQYTSRRKKIFVRTPLSRNFNYSSFSKRDLVESTLASHVEVTRILCRNVCLHLEYIVRFSR